MKGLEFERLSSVVIVRAALAVSLLFIASGAALLAQTSPPAGSQTDAQAAPAPAPGTAPTADSPAPTEPPADTQTTAAPASTPRSAPAPAADYGADYNNRWDLYGGFAYAHFNGVGNVRATGLYGLNAQATAWIKPVFGLAASARVNYGTYPVTPNSIGVSSPPISQDIFLFGPEFRLWRTPKHALGFHVLVGGVYGKFSNGLKGAQPNSLGLFVDQLAFASAIGASFDFNLSPRLSVRIITDYAPTHYGSANQQEFAGSAGVVYKMGSLRPGK